MDLTPRSFDRRQFLKLSAGAALLYSVGRFFPMHTGRASEPLPKRTLGKTGFRVSLFSLGGQGIIEQPGTEEESVAIIEKALDEGVNYIDTAPSYGRGTSEQYIGRVMKHRRDEVFLATKTHDRTYSGTMRLFEESLERLQTDYIDLYQLHNVRTDQDLEGIFGDGGALEALLELKEQGVVKHLGITGHRDPQVLLDGIGRFDFDCILLALNPADIHHDPFQTDLLEMAVEKDMGIVAMKIPAHQRIFRDDGITSMDQALGYVYTLPISTAIVGLSTMEQLEENVAITKAFRPLSKAEMEELEDLTAHYYEEASFFKFRW